MKKIELLGINTEVEYDESKICKYTEDDGVVYDAVETTDGRLIIWDDAANSWVQIKRWA